ncbi:MAG: phage major capsid protein [Candidatus Devosia phytovorans]|uniref:Phage major capsid protein n=1 Tax=Candidatus Devosia phytovorans TaxID=3121372 RepID=A0AAJ5VVW3_9HYPH|nr:phage major capsid protein [Devosia sp.]WEK05759.1 MAG: phage major capsid protein [Devosia sp.]
MEAIFKTLAAKGDGLDFVLSDATVDRYGDIIDPNGWDLKAFKKNPIALFGHSNDFPIGTWSNLRVEGGKLIGRLVLATKGTSARIDELINLVEQGILRAVSVGFIPKKWEPLDAKEPYAGQRYLSQELIETSLVSVPANPAALQLAKSMHLSPETMSLAFGEHAEVRRRDVSTPGKSAAKPRTPTQKGTAMSPLTKRIEDAQTNYNAARDAYEAHVGEDDYDLDQAETLQAEMEERSARLESLKTAERSLASRTVPNGGGSKPGAPAVRKPLGIKEREPKAGDLVVRAAVVQLIANVTQRDPLQVLEERYRDHEGTNIFVRAAVDPAKTTVQGWASELIETETVAFLETLRDVSFYPRLAALGANLQFGVGRGQIKVPRRAATPSISGSFVGEGAPIPVRRFGLTSLTLSPHKMGVISYFTKEVAKYSNPQIEGLLRQEIRGDTAEAIDTLLIDNQAGSSIRPAGLLNGVSALTASAAGGWLAVMEDIETLAAPFDTAKAGRSLVLLLNKREARRLGLVPGPDGKLGVLRAILEEAGITPIASTNVPAGRLIMLDAADFATAAGDQPEFDVSEEAVIHAEDTSPQQISTAGSPNAVAAPVISMFQTASVALRMLLDVTWGMRRPGMIQWIDGADWSFTVDTTP